jgi:NAD(P)-dependent dehydrogenase (short-subunit alcohol dehydrogenase family)
MAASRVVLITGGAKGIGRAICQAFSTAKDKVYFVDLDIGAGEELASATGSVFIPCDVSDQESIRQAVEQVAKDGKRIDVLVNNAGIALNLDFLSSDAISAFEKVINVNLHGTFLFSHYAAQHMTNGAIINIASTRALQSEANTEGYSASKGGIVALTHAMAMSLAPRHIRVNAISPGWIDVQEYQSTAASNKPSSHANRYQITQKDREQHPIGRVGVPDDIANMVLFLSDKEKSGFITGQNFVIDGGMTKKMIYI